MYLAFVCSKVIPIQNFKHLKHTPEPVCRTMVGQGGYIGNNEFHSPFCSDFPEDSKKEELQSEQNDPFGEFLC